MIKELVIKNFEAHDKFRAKLDRHITTFTGATDAGKSSIIRAIKWVVLNRPLGDSFIRDESKPAYVGIKTEKGIVSRKKGKKVNIYKVNGQVLEAFGSNVPEEVQQFLCMEELNFQFQFDAPYWFMISPGEVSKQLNQIVDLEIIDHSLSKLAAKLRQERTEANICQQRLDKTASDMEQLSFVEPMAKEHDRLEQLESGIEEGRAGIASLTDAIQDMERYGAHAKALGSAHAGGAKLVATAQRYETKAREAETLASTIQDLEQDMALVEAEIPDVKSLSSVATEWEDLDYERLVLERLIEDTVLEREQECQRGKELSSGERKLKRMIGETCPLCGSKVATRS